MSEAITIQGRELAVKIYHGQRVLTFKDIDEAHNRSDGTAKRNFLANKDKFIPGEDYFFVKPEDLQKNEIRTSEINNRGTTLLTESGYLMLVKSFTDDLAWQVQRELVKGYFRGQTALCWYILEGRQVIPLQEAARQLGMEKEEARNAVHNHKEVFGADCFKLTAEQAAQLREQSARPNGIQAGVKVLTPRGVELLPRYRLRRSGYLANDPPEIARLRQYLQMAANALKEYDKAAEPFKLLHKRHLKDILLTAAQEIENE